MSPEPVLEKRKSALSLPSRASAPSLFDASTPSLTPGTHEDSPFSHPSNDKRHFGKAGDSRYLVRSDAEVPELGEALFHQPRSRAVPLPSASVLDFGKVHEQLKQQKAQLAKKKFKSPPRPSRPASHDRAYESQTWTVEPALQGNGGLVNAMLAAAEASSDMTISWIGTIGFPTDALPQSVRDDINDHMLNEYNSEVVYVTDKDFNGHYTHFCKTILWPIFHYQVPDHPKSKAYADHSWEFYQNLNQAFADKVVSSYRKGDEVWVHDYHLLLVPGMIRQKLPDAKIGFFLHSAFPSSEVFRCLAKRKQLLDGMLGANLIAFQVEEYAQHFLQTCSRLLTVETTPDGVQLENHFVNVTSQPMGINPPAIAEAHQSEEVRTWIEDIANKYAGKMLIVARDKLDHVHGIRQKLLAFELFLNKHPEWATEVVLIQVATSTAEQSELLTTITDICNRIDANHSSVTNQPLVFLKQDIDFSQYLALLTVADVLMISALRDGMNLQAHDFVFCQAGAWSGKKFGPLILSEFTGSAAMFEHQISINPWDYQGQAKAIKQALEMSEAEKEQRWSNMYGAVMRNDGKRWFNELNATLVRVYDEHHQRASTSVPRLSAPQISQAYKNTTLRLFLLDYEGTLEPHRTRQGIALSSPNRIVDTLNDLMTDPRNIVYIMSGRQVRELNSEFRTAAGLGLIAENGCFYHQYGAASDEWTSQVDMEMVNSFKRDVKAILKYYVERMEGSYIEESRCSLLFRYEKVEDQDTAHRQAGDCADQINSACQSYRIQAVPVGKAVLVQLIDYNKKTAATRIFNTLCDKLKAEGKATPDFLTVVGDDREDEIVFRWANDLAKHGAVRDVFTVSVGKRNTEAKAALTQGSTGLLAVLQKLAKISLDTTPVDYFGSPRKQRKTSEAA